MIKVLPYAWTPMDAYGAKIVLWAAHLDALRKEEFTTAASTALVTPVAVAGNAASPGDLVGSVISPIDGHVWTANGDAYRPTLGTDGTRNAYLSFGAGGQPSSLILQNSFGAFRPTFTTQCYTIAFMIRMVTNSGSHVGSDTSSQTIIDNCSNANTHRGFQIQRDSDGSVEMDIAREGHWIGYNNSAANLLIAGGANNTGAWTPIVMIGNGIGAVKLYIGGALVNGVFTPGSGGHTVTLANLYQSGAGDPIGSNASYNLTIGSTASIGQHAQFDFDNLVMTDDAVVIGDANSWLTNWYNFNPPLTSASLLRVKSNSSKLVPSDINYRFVEHDATRPTDDAGQPTMWADTAKTTPVTITSATTGYQQVQVLEHLGGAHLMRALTLPAEVGSTGYPVAPIWTMAGQNGKPGLLFTGAWNGVNGVSGISNPTALGYANLIPPCDKTWYYVLQQTSNGSSGSPGVGQIASHILGWLGGNGYLAVGGRYHSAPDAVIEHLATASTNAPEAASFSALTFVTSTTPASAGAYTLVTLTNQNPASNSGQGGFNNPTATNITDTYYGFTAGSTPSFYNPATQLYLYMLSSNWFLSPTNGANGTYLGSTPHWVTTSNEFDILSAYSASGGATTNTTPTGTPTTGPIAPHVIHGQQSGTNTRVGCDGYWGSWTPNTSPTAAMAWTAYGYDFQQGASLTGIPSNTQHFELNGMVYEPPVIFNYSLPDHVFWGLMRTVQAKYAIPNMYIGN